VRAYAPCWLVHRRSLRLLSPRSCSCFPMRWTGESLTPTHRRCALNSAQQMEITLAAPLDRHSTGHSIGHFTGHSIGHSAGHSAGHSTGHCTVTPMATPITDHSTCHPVHLSLHWPLHCTGHSMSHSEAAPLEKKTALHKQSRDGCPFPSDRLPRFVLFPLSTWANWQLGGSNTILLPKHK
jgi:hypothetical protein